MRSFTLALFLAAALTGTPAFAQTQNATNAGFYTAGISGVLGANGTYFTGTATNGVEHRGFLQFTVPASATPYNAAVLRLNVNTVAGGPNTLSVYDVSSVVGTDPVATVFTDLGSGTLLGSATGINTSDATIEITLNAQGLVLVNAARGSTITLGFLNETISGPGDYLFHLTGSTTPRQIVLTAAPAPVPTMTEWAMILFGSILAGGAALYIRRRQMVV